MKRLFTLALLSICWLHVAAQVTISGSVVDHETRKPLPFASVALRGDDGKTLSAGTITNEQGRFALSGIGQATTR